MPRSHRTHRLDSVANAHDQVAVLLHLVDELHGQHAAVERLAELLCCSVQSASEAVALKEENTLAHGGGLLGGQSNKKKPPESRVSYDGEKAGGETGDEIFASSSADDGVVGAGDGGAVISGHHQAHLDELAGVPRQPGKGVGGV